MTFAAGLCAAVLLAGAAGSVLWAAMTLSATCRRLQATAIGLTRLNTALRNVADPQR